MLRFQSVFAFILLSVTTAAWAEDAPAPRIARIDSAGDPIELRIFDPVANSVRARSAILLFHGGGWNEGEASWMDPLAQHYAGLGLVAISVEYRLSDGSTTTPFDAVADARNAIRWARTQAEALQIAPDRIIALGTSAGGHLAAATAVFDEPGRNPVSSKPNALILRSAAVSVHRSAWFQKLVGGREQAAALSPDLHVRVGLPPTLILQGAEDNLTPAAGAEFFCTQLRLNGARCDLKLYPGVGHLFTRNLAQQEIPDYPAIDREVVADAKQRSDEFLRTLGLLKPPEQG